MGLHSALQRFPGLRILVVGDAILDEYWTGDCSRISPEAPVPVLAVSGARSVPGGAANTAHNVRTLGGHAVLVAAIGSDEAGGTLARQIAEAGIEFHPVVTSGPTTRKVRVLGLQQQLLRLDYESSDLTTGAREATIAAIVERELPACDCLVISDYAKGLLTAPLAHRLVQLARERGRPVIVDPRPQHGAFYDGADYLTPNWKESLGLLGWPERPATPEAIEEVGARLAARFDANVLLTLGASGMRLFGRDGRFIAGAAPAAREVFDVSGAGDTVVAAFSLAVSAGCSAADAIDLANVAAGVVVGKVGTATVSAGELLAGDAPDRLVVRSELRPLAERLRARKQRLVTINGSFDLLHAGHLHILREAKAQGDVLLVGLNSDASVRAYKGPTRPFINQAERAAHLLALRDVDYVHIFDEATPNAFLACLNPDVHVNGSEYGADCVEAPVVRAGGGRIHIIERIPGLSTSELLGRVVERLAPSSREQASAARNHAGAGREW